jgi:hypothetical protein
VTKLFETQSAVFTRLKSGLVSVEGVFDYVPEKTEFPYVVLGRTFATPQKTKTSTGERIEVTFDVWSDSKGKKETIHIVNEIEASLAEELTVEGAFVISQEITSIEVLEEVNNLYHGTVVFEILLDLE